MFSYNTFIKSCLKGKRERRSCSTEDSYIISLSSAEPKSIHLNSLNFDPPKPNQDRLNYSPKVPQLPSMGIPLKLSFTHRPKTIEASPNRVKKSQRSISRFKKHSVASPPETFKSTGQSKLKVSSLNTSYCCKEKLIMENIEKAKKYFPIPLGRKQLRTTSLSISHTPMSRLYSPQNFAKRARFLIENEERKSADHREMKTEIEVEGKKTGKKYKMMNVKKVKKCDLYDLLIEFNGKIELFKKKFEEIDRQGKGYLNIENFKRLSKETKEKITELFFKVSGRKQVFLNEFLAISAVFLHNGGDVKGLKIFDLENLKKITEEIEELKRVFEVHTKGTIIPKYYLKGLTEFLQPGEDVLKSESLVLCHTIDFIGFLRWVPYFLYIHTELLNKAFQ